MTGGIGRFNLVPCEKKVGITYLQRLSERLCTKSNFVFKPSTSCAEQNLGDPNPGTRGTTEKRNTLHERV
ncbi:hypothetical protein G7K_6851-t1 [Saitoella complicata NRRL Y-17804]|uniref:Uncharacterized protein n=1 Tax=Saitoella complicata (strain BCRC 22490 / CBS 7301 / JCM 7358 / NBRC 10748 / NRRL Y-17804) TaxID=698492 RepID=A0A0E9NSF1_SAICN|nr:hypothetical protein G7K_6851-t1 [Saitoella complicata NRRL Y-17804]